MKSKTRKQRHGVPQGSVISPILFCVYVDGILKNLERDHTLRPVMFADDLTVILGAPTDEGIVEKAKMVLEDIITWGEKKLANQPRED